MDLLCSTNKSLIFRINKYINRTLAFSPAVFKSVHFPAQSWTQYITFSTFAEIDEEKCCLGTVLIQCLKLEVLSSTLYIHFLAICISTLVNAYFVLFAIFVYTLQILMSFLISHFVIYLFILFVGLFIFLQCNFSFLCSQCINPFPFDGFFCNYDLKSLPRLQAHINPTYFNTNPLIILCFTWLRQSIWNFLWWIFSLQFCSLFFPRSWEL